MRRSFVVAIAGMTFLGVAAVGGPAEASAPVAETITIVQAFPGGPPAGWFSSGAFNDSGQWSTDSIVGSLPSPVTAAFHRSTTEIGADGTFHLTIDFTITVIGLATATWVIPRTGTRAYASLTGQGSCATSFGPGGIFLVTCAGQVHFG